MALTLAQSKAAAGNSSAPSVTLTSAPTPGDLMVAAFMANDDSGGISINTVSAGYGLVPSAGDVDNPGECHMWVYSKIAGVGESATIHASLDDNRRWLVFAGQYHDSAGGSWGIDRRAEDVGSSSNPDTGTTAATTRAVEAWVAFIVNKNNSSQSAPTNGFVQQEGLNSGGSDSKSIYGGMYDKIVAATGPAGMAVTLGASRAFGGGVYTFYSLSIPKTPLTVTRALQNRVTRVRRLPHSKLREPTVVLNIPYAVNTVPPVVSGSPVVGQTLSTTDGTWTGGPTFTYQWERDDHGGGTYTPIVGATANTYLLVDADDACRIRCQVTGHNVRGASSPAASNAVGPVTEPLPANTVAPSVTGNPQVGSPLITDAGTWLHMGGYNPSFSYKWQESADGVSGWTDIPGATHAFYWPTSGDLGGYLRAVVTATNTGGSTAQASAAIGPIGTQIVVSEQTTLGCGQYEAIIFERGGRNLVAILPWTALTWGRVLDDTSVGSAEGVIGQDSSCCAAIAAVRTWRHELAIYDHGVQVWVGPIYDIRTPPGTFKFQARDLTAWWDHRRIHDNHDFAETDLAIIFQALADDAMAPDESPGLTVTTSPSGVRGSRRILTVQHQMAGPALRDLTNTGIDWTAVGRTVVAGGLVVPTDPIGTFLDEHFAIPPTPILDGSTQANARTVRGAGGGQLGDTIYATAEDAAAIAADGLLESVDSVSTIVDYNSAIQAAETKLALTSAVKAVEGCQLAPSAPFTIDKLVPGALCELNLSETCIPVSGPFRLKSVNVSAQSGADDSVTLVFQPEGTT